jgi:hypothetical protein
MVLESCYFFIICCVPWPCINVCVLRAMAKHPRLSRILEASRLVKYLGNVCSLLGNVWLDTLRLLFFIDHYCQPLNNKYNTCTWFHHMFIVVSPMSIDDSVMLNLQLPFFPLSSVLVLRSHVTKHRRTLCRWICLPILAFCWTFH